MKSGKTVCYEIFRDLERETTTAGEDGEIHVEVNPEIEQLLKEEEQQSILDLERRIGRRIIILARENFHLEQYEISY